MNNKIIKYYEQTLKDIDRALLVAYGDKEISELNELKDNILFKLNRVGWGCGGD